MSSSAQKPPVSTLGSCHFSQVLPVPGKDAQQRNPHFATKACLASHSNSPMLLICSLALSSGRHPQGNNDTISNSSYGSPQLSREAKYWTHTAIKFQAGFEPTLIIPQGYFGMPQHLNPPDFHSTSSVLSNLTYSITRDWDLTFLSLRSKQIFCHWKKMGHWRPCPSPAPNSYHPTHSHLRQEAALSHLHLVLYVWRLQPSHFLKLHPRASLSLSGALCPFYLPSHLLKSFLCLHFKP